MEISAGSGPTSSMSRNTCPRRIWFWSVETLVESGTVIHGMMAGLDWLDSLPYTTAFVLGNHENYDAYKRLSQRGVAWRTDPEDTSLRPASSLRGQVYELNGRKFFTMGGASSHDIQDGILEPDDPDFEEKFQQLEQRGALFRVNHRSWWAEELPSEAEYLEARANLERGPLECGLHHQPLLPLQHTGCVQRRNVQERRTDRVLR